MNAWCKMVAAELKPVAELSNLSRHIGHEGNANKLSLPDISGGVGSMLFAVSLTSEM